MLYFDAPARPTIAVTSVAEARAAGPSSLFVAGMLLRIQGVNFLDFDPTSMAADNGTTVLKPDDIPGGSPGRWISAASGAQGAQGGTGVQGAQGSNGAQGAQGTGTTLLVNRIDTGNVGGSQLVAINTTSLDEGSLANVYSVGSLFILVKAPTAALLTAVDGKTVVASTATVGSVWVRLSNVANPRFANNPPTEIDPGAGDDDNDGLTFATAIETADEWCRRMDGAVITANFGTVTVNCAAGSVGNFGPCKIVSKVPLGGVVVFRFLGAKTLSAQTGTVSSAVSENPATQTEYQFTDSSGVGPTIASNSRLRITASGTPARVNTVGVVRGFAGGGATNPYCGPFTSLAGTVWPAAGDSYVVETLTTIMQGCSIQVDALGLGLLTCMWEDLEKSNASSSVPGLGPSSNQDQQQNAHKPTFFHCRTAEIVVTRIERGGLRFVGHEFVTAINGVGTGLNSFEGCVFRVGGILQYPLAFSMSGSCVLEGASLALQGFGTFTDFLISRMGATTGLLPGSISAWSLGTARIWTPPLGARNAATTPLALVTGSLVIANAFSQFSSLSGSFAAISENGRVISQFTSDDSTSVRLLCTDSSDGALKYLRSISGNPATAPVAGAYLYSVGTDLRYMDTAGTVHVLGAQGAQGAQGSAGTGSQGSQGSIGVQGAQGSVGSQGAQGSAGAQGFQGASGSTGAQGSQGEPGPLMGPIQYDFWVGTLATPPAVPSGEIEAPFLTVADCTAVTKLLPAGSYIAIHVTSLDYTADTLDLSTDPGVPGGKSYRVVSEIGGSAFSAVTADTTDGDVVVILEDIASSGVTISGTGTGDLIARGRGLALSNVTMTGLAGGSVYLDHVEVTRLNAPPCSFVAYSSTITGHVDVDHIGRIDDCDFGASAEDVRHFNVASTSDPSRQNFTQCRMHSGYSYTDAGGSIFASDDFTMNQWISSFGGFATGTSWIHLDFKLDTWPVVLDSTNSDATIGNGSIAASFMINGNVMTVKIVITQGTTTDYGTGATRFQLPDAWVIVAGPEGIEDTNGILTASDNSLALPMQIGNVAGGKITLHDVISNFGASTTSVLILTLDVPVAPATA